MLEYLFFSTLFYCIDKQYFLNVVYQKFNFYFIF